GGLEGVSYLRDWVEDHMTEKNCWGAVFSLGRGSGCWIDVVLFDGIGGHLGWRELFSLLGSFFLTLEVSFLTLGDFFWMLSASFSTLSAFYLMMLFLLDVECSLLNAEHSLFEVARFLFDAGGFLLNAQHFLFVVTFSFGRWELFIER